MKSQDIGLQRALFIQLLVHLFHQFGGLAEIIHAPDLNAPHTHIVKSVRDRFRGQVHIENSSDSAGQIFQYCQL